MTNPANPPDGQLDSDPAIAAHLAGVPDTLPLTWCTNCKMDVLPKGKGKCPKCGRILPLSFLARRHPVNKARKLQILDKLLADYQPQNGMLRDTCDDLAGVREQLEALKPGSQEHKRLLELSQQLYATLEESRSTATSSQAATLATYTTAQLIEKTAGILQQLLEREQAEQRPSRTAAATSEPEAETPAESTPPPDPVVCQYCRRPCVGPDHRSYAVLHWRSPEETQKRIERRNQIEAATAGRPLPEWYR